MNSKVVAFTKKHENFLLTEIPETVNPTNVPPELIKLDHRDNVKQQTPVEPTKSAILFNKLEFKIATNNALGEQTPNRFIQSIEPLSLQQEINHFEQSFKSPPISPKQSKVSKDARHSGKSKDRETYLEKNRKAAIKCRQKKKNYVNGLEAKVVLLETENADLKTQILILNDELKILKSRSLLK
jgi:hypothetical protein